MRETIVVRSGYRIRVRTRGPRNGPDAVILPGMGATAFALAPQIRRLQALGYRTHVIDLPGFGLTPALRKEDARFSQLADLVIAACDQLGIERMVILGHSLGGGIALYVTLQRRALVAGLILIAPAALGMSLVWTYKLFCLPVIGRALLQPRRGTRQYVRYFLIGHARRDDAHFTDQLVRHDDQSAAKARSMRAIVWANQPPRLRRILVLLSPGGEQSGFTLRDTAATFRDIPTLVLWGSDDRVISARDADHFRVVSPEAEVHIAAGMGHMLPLEAAHWTNEHIASFDTLRLRPTRPARAA